MIARFINALNIFSRTKQSSNSGMGNLFRCGCQNWLKSMGKFLRGPNNSSCSPQKISVETKQKGLHVRRCPVFTWKHRVKSKKKVSTLSDILQKKFKGHMLVSHTSAAAFPLTRFSGVACVPEKGSSSPAQFGTRARGCHSSCPNL